MSPRIEKCRLCAHPHLDFILNLGMQSFTGIFPKSLGENTPQGPLEIAKCQRCDLVQLNHSFDLNQLYGKTYGYRSGLNQSMVRHLRAKVEKIVKNYNPKPGDLIIDIGSNDSTLLQSYPEIGLDRVGVDPSGVKFKHHYPANVKLIPDFFSAGLVRKNLGDRKAKVITSIAMFYDLEKPQSFVNEIASLLDEDGVWVAEQSYMPLMIDQNAYDTICHEHLEYYALKQVHWMFEKANLKLIDLEFNDVNGGSFSFTAAKKSSLYPECTELLNATLIEEEKRGFSTMKPFVDFAAGVETHRNELLDVIHSIRSSGKTIFGYGASTKGNVVLQYLNLTTKEIPYIAEVNEDKFGAYTPGTHIPIISEAEARAMNPDYFLVLPWHFRQGIIDRETAFLENSGGLIFPLPMIDIITGDGSVGHSVPGMPGIIRSSKSKPLLS